VKTRIFAIASALVYAQNSVTAQKIPKNILVAHLLSDKELSTEAAQLRVTEAAKQACNG